MPETSLGSRLPPSARNQRHGGAQRPINPLNINQNATPLPISSHAPQKTDSASSTTNRQLTGSLKQYLIPSHLTSLNPTFTSSSIDELRRKLINLN